MPHLLSHWTIGRARRSKLVAGIAAIALIAACGSDSTTGPNSSSPVGSYTMTTVNGKALPTSLFAEGTYSFDVTGGTLQLTNDGKFSTITNTRQTLPGSVENFVDTVDGTWTQSGSTVQMAFQDGTTVPATWDRATVSGSFMYQGVAVAIVYGNKK